MPASNFSGGRIGTSTSKFLEFDFTTGRSVGPNAEVLQVRLEFHPPVDIPGGGWRADVDYNDIERGQSGRHAAIEFASAQGRNSGAGLLAHILSTFDGGGQIPSPRFP